MEVVAPAGVAAARLADIRASGHRLRAATVLVVAAAVGVDAALAFHSLPGISQDLQFRLAAFDVVLSIVVLTVALCHLRNLLRDRARRAIVDGLVDTFAEPASIESAARAAVAWLAGAEVAQAALVAVVHDENAEQQRLTPLAAAGYPEDWDAADRTVGERLAPALHVAREAVESDPLVRPLANSVGSRPWVARVPITRGDEVLGMLVLVGRHAGALHNERLLMTVGSLIASALDHARLYQTEYEHALELEEQDSRRREFLYAIAHELRSPLNSIQAFAELLMADASLAAGQQQMLASLARGVERLSGLVNDLLNLGRVEQPAMTVAVKPVDVVEAMQNAETILRPALMSREQAWSMEVTHQPLMALGDGQALEQVLLNLISNASRYTPPHGSVSARACTEDGHVRLEVCDSGPGIAPEDRQRIFEPFYRVRRPGAPEVPGSGLGLAIARRLTQLQGGRIWVEDADDTGSRFCVELNAASTSSEEPAAADTEANT